MAQDIDYDSDVLKFKQVWTDNKNPDQTRVDLKTAVDPKNLQTIQSNRRKQKSKNHPQQQQQNVQKNTHKNKGQSNKKASLSKNTFAKPPLQSTIRNPKPNTDQVIEVSTKANKFYTSNLQNQKHNIATSHLYLDAGISGSNKNAPTYTSANEWKKALQQKDYQLSMLRVSNSRTEDRVRYLERQLQKKNSVIEQLRDRQRKIAQKNCSLQSKQFNFDYGKTEYENFRNDSRRLLKMLQSTDEYKDFARFALDDDGVRFLHNVNKDHKTKMDSSSNKKVQSIHFCTCNKAFIPQSGFWVPQKVYSFGKQFVKQRKGQLTQPELQLLLYELNKIWRQRQKRIINTYSALKAHEVGKYKRKLQNLSVSKDVRVKSAKQDNLDNQQQ